jgi:hypothetical protein
MDGFISSALLAVARKCERLSVELESLRNELEDVPDNEAPRRLASRQIIRVNHEAEEARRLAEGILEMRETGANTGSIIRKRALSRYRRCVAVGRFAEYYVVPFLRGYDDEAVVLTKLCREIAVAVAWPHDWPIVSRGASNYFHFIAEEYDELILTPALAGSTVLPFPDLVHEMAHALVRNNQKRQTILGSWCNDEYIRERVLAAVGDDRFGSAAVRHWLEHGVEEIACDVIAAWVTGPAYAWQHIRACWGREEGKSVYDDGVHHPPDSGRFGVIQLVLERVGGTEQQEEIVETWARVVVGEDDGDADNAGFYPVDLMLELASEVVVGCVRAGIRSFPETLAEDDPCRSFSDGWTQMRDNPFAFDELEKSR